MEIDISNRVCGGAVRLRCRAIISSPLLLPGRNWRGWSVVGCTSPNPCAVRGQPAWLVWLVPRVRVACTARCVSEEMANLVT